MRRNQSATLLAILAVLASVRSTVFSGYRYSDFGSGISGQDNRALTSNVMKRYYERKSYLDRSTVMSR